MSSENVSEEANVSATVLELKQMDVESQPHVVKGTDEKEHVDVVSLDADGVEETGLSESSPLSLNVEGADETARLLHEMSSEARFSVGEKQSHVEEAVKTTGVGKETFEEEKLEDGEEEEEDPAELNKGLRLNERTILKLQEAFSLFDHDLDGRLTLHQAATMMRAVGLGLTEKHIAEILAEAPTAKIDFGTFLTSMADHLRAIRENRAEEEAKAIRDAFLLIEEAGSGRSIRGERGGGEREAEGGKEKAVGGRGKMTRRRLTRLLTRVGEKLSKHEIDELLDDVGLGEASPDEEIHHEALVEKIFEDY